MNTVFRDSSPLYPKLESTEVWYMESEVTDNSGSTSVLSPSNISLEKSELGRKPKRIIHCSDGIVEEYSTDEEDGEAEPEPVVDTKTLTWGPYLWYYTTTAAIKTFHACEYLGEKLAYFFGITSPRYQYAITEFHRLEEEEKRELKEQEERRERIRDEIAMREAQKYNDAKAASMTVPGQI